MQPTRTCGVEWCDREAVGGTFVCLNHGVGIWNAMHDIINERLGNPQGDRLLTREQVRTMVPQVRPATLRAWIHRGNLRPVTVTPAGTELFSLNSVEALIRKDGKLPSGDPLVYYVRLDNGHIKIGYTTNLKSRMVSLRYKGAAVLATEPGGREVELERHEQFAASRIGRLEEFAETSELMEHVASLAAN